MSDTPTPETLSAIRERVEKGLKRAQFRQENSTESEIFRFVIDKWGAKSGRDIALKLCEESGEVAGAVIRLDEKRGTEDQIAEEVGDVLIVASQLAFILGTTLEQLRSDRWETIKNRTSKGDSNE